jgi:hypothetical protein
METILLSREEVAKRAKKIYETKLRQQVETAENIGKMIIIDVETEEYAINKTGLESAHYLKEKHPNARLFGICIGYNVAASFGGVVKRTNL